MHLAGAIPKSAMQHIREIAANAPKKHADMPASKHVALSRRVFQQMEHWLDRSHYCPLLSNPDVANMVDEALRHRVAKSQLEIYEHVIMPNHLHLFLSVLNGTLKHAIENFKRWTGHQAAKIIDLPYGRFWQDEWFDHWSRSDEQDDRIIAYIRNNPVKASLVSRSHDWEHMGPILKVFRT